MTEHRDGAAFTVRLIGREGSAKDRIHAEDAGVALGDDLAAHAQRVAVTREIEIAARKERGIVERRLALHEAAIFRIRPDDLANNASEVGA
jgi:hypothetical protein